MIRRAIRCLQPTREPIGKPISLALDPADDLRARNVNLQQRVDRLKAELAYYGIKYDPPRPKG